MSIKHADLAAAIRTASEGDDSDLMHLPLAGISLDHMTIVSCTGKMYNELQSSNRMIIKQRDVIEHLRGEVDDRSNHADCLELQLEKLTRTNAELARCNYEQTVTIAALMREAAQRDA